MKMTEKMKQELEEYMKQEGAELSDEELDEITGGRGLTEREVASLNITTEDDYDRRSMIMYLKYIDSLPEGSPEVLFDPDVSYPYPEKELKFERHTDYHCPWADDCEA